MSEYATHPTNTTNPILNPRIYWRVSAFALAAIALLGFIVNLAAGNKEAGIMNFLEFDYAHNILHVVLAAAAFTFGFARVPAGVSKVFAIVFGVVYLGLGVIGLVGGLDYNLFGLDLISLELGENLVHVLLGAWALMAGLFARYD